MRERLLRSARKVMKNAYAPFSKFQRGRSHPHLEGRSLRGMQCRELFLRNDELRRAHRDLFCYR